MRLVFLFACLLRPTPSRAETVPVRYPEGVSHGYLVLRTLDGKTIADGDSIQVVRGDHVINRMRFRFKDGSIYDETTVFSQRGTFCLLSDHVVQKGPIFQKPMDAVIDTGFNGFLTLPTRRIASLTLTYAGSTRAVLGDGQEVSLDLFEATVLWDGQEREAAVLAAEGSALVGMALLSGYRVTLEVKGGGVVTIENLS